LAKYGPWLMLVLVLVRVLARGQAVNQASVKGAVKKPAGGTGGKKGGGDAAPAEVVEVSGHGQLKHGHYWESSVPAQASFIQETAPVSYGPFINCLL